MCKNLKDRKVNQQNIYNLFYLSAFINELTLCFYLVMDGGVFFKSKYPTR